MSKIKDDRLAQEFNIINDYFSQIQFNTNTSIELGIGDDAAVFSVDQLNNRGKHFLVSADMLCEGTHFLKDIEPEDLGYKSLAVNISDILAMGGVPEAFTLCISLPEINHQWLKKLSQGLAQAAELFGVTLIGGDTTRGPLSISIQIFGSSNHVLKRSGAKSGDLIAVTGTLGDSAGGLAFLLDPALAANFADDFQPHVQYLQKRHLRPEPKSGLTTSDLNMTSCIDLSDGLISDVAHICRASQVNALIDPELLPISSALLAVDANPVEKALAGGEDYELCFTCSPADWQAIKNRADALEISVTIIGKIGAVDDNGSPEMNIKGWSPAQISQLTSKSFTHFS